MLCQSQLAFYSALDSGGFGFILIAKGDKESYLCYYYIITNID